ncbi:LEAF RUST 10 DISEASE-RESISTANCE LOCUS RECEPTOR-LIKE PROTEIN KINASE-like 1.2 [Hirschfeldia incana]|nr:LEAF RUST 10 DISEASE-RESISTANCE LOCUS RECEPTOR-LIKE PROTEIN KINASE-like 1.2 [Hirschfeldia incana]
MSISLLLIISAVLYTSDLPPCFSADQQYEECRLPLRCGSEPSLFPNITYPFWGHTIGKPSFCGQKEFELSCNENKALTLELESFTLRVISLNLDNKTITVADDSLFEDGCPHIFNFTGAKQFTLNHNTELVDVFNCADNNSTGSLSKVSCQLSKENPITYHVFGSAHPPKNCTKVGEIPMLESVKNELRQANGSDQALKIAFEKGFELRYDKEDKTCRGCTHTDGICGSDSRSGSFVCLCTDRPHEYSCHDQRGPNYEVKLGIGAAASVFGISAASLAWFVYHRRITKIYRTSSALLPRNLSSDQYSKPSSDIEKAEELLAGVRLFSYEELEEATNNFDPSKELGDGGFGTVYYGKLKDGRSVAVKRLYENNFKRAAQFRNEVEILTGLRHPNLVTLFGCSSKQSRDLLLVYEYVANGTLADHLHGPHANPSSLPWSTRLKIAVETASALKYLHASEIIHRDVKSTNILLDENFNVKVADFGLSRLFPTGQTHVSTGPQGTPGYVDPDYHLSYQLSNKSDVYSFAVVLMELISSLPAVDVKRSREEINLSNMAVIKIQNRKIQEMVDPSLGFDTNTEVRQSVIAVAELAFQCLQSDKDLRPCMTHVMETLTRIQNNRFGSEMDVADVSKSGPLVAQSVDVGDVSKSEPLVAQSVDVADVSKSGPLVALSLDVAAVSKSGPLVAQSPDSVMVKWISK